MELALPFELIDGIASGGAEIALHPIVGLQWRWVGTDRPRGRDLKPGNRHLSPPNSATSRTRCSGDLLSGSPVSVLVRNGVRYPDRFFDRLLLIPSA